MNKQLFIKLFSTFFVSNVFAQNINPSCNFYSLSQLMVKVKPDNTKADLDVLFGIKGIAIEQKGKTDSSSKMVTYQFCDSNIVNSITVSFRNNKLVYIQKNFRNGKCYNKDDNGGFAFEKNSSYKEIKNIFSQDGDLKAIYWGSKDLKEIERVYEWMNCNKINYYSVMFKEGNYISHNQFPKKQDYSRPSRGKKQ